MPPDGPPGSSGPPRTLTVRTEADLLAVVPTSFGFHPEESLVMMVVGRDGHPMFARVDLPAGPDEADAAAAEFVQAAVVNLGESVVLIAYTDDEDAAFRAIVHVVGDLADAGFGLMIAMRADGRRWYRVLPGPEDLEGVPYDLESHPITAAAVMAGQVTHARRDDLAQSLLPRDPDLVDAVAVAHAALPAVDPDAMPAEARWLDDWVTARLDAGEGMGEVDPDDAGAGGARPRRQRAQRGGRGDAGPRRGRGARAAVDRRGEALPARPAGAGRRRARAGELAGGPRCDGVVRDRPGAAERPRLHHGAQRRSPAGGRGAAVGLGAGRPRGAQPAASLSSSSRLAGPGVEKRRAPSSRSLRRSDQASR